MRLKLLKVDQMVLCAGQYGLLLWLGLPIPIGIGQGKAGIAAKFIPITP